MLRFATVLFALPVALAACGGGDEPGAGPGAGETPAATSSPAASTPPAAEFLKGVSIAVEGFTSSDVRTVPSGANATFTSKAVTAGGANVVVLVQASACDPFICNSLRPDDYKSAASQTALKSTLPSAHIQNPALRWQFGAVEVAPGKSGLFTYALSYLETKDASGGTTRSSANAYRAWFHDGQALISVDVFSRGGLSAQSVADLERNMSRADAETAAKTVFAAVSAELMR